MKKSEKENMTLFNKKRIWPCAFPLQMRLSHSSLKPWCIQFCLQEQVADSRAVICQVPILKHSIRGQFILITVGSPLYPALKVKALLSHPILPCLLPGLWYKKALINYRLLKVQFLILWHTIFSDLIVASKIPQCLYEWLWFIHVHGSTLSPDMAVSWFICPYFYPKIQAVSIYLWFLTLLPWTSLNTSYISKQRASVGSGAKRMSDS